MSCKEEKYLKKRVALRPSNIGVHVTGDSLSPRGGLSVWLKYRLCLVLCTVYSSSLITQLRASLLLLSLSGEPTISNYTGSHSQRRLPVYSDSRRDRGEENRKCHAHLECHAHLFRPSDLCGATISTKLIFGGIYEKGNCTRRCSSQPFTASIS